VAALLRLPRIDHEDPVVGLRSNRSQTAVLGCQPAAHVGDSWSFWASSPVPPDIRIIETTAVGHASFVGVRA
jgi:hypothetical protein